MAPNALTPCVSKSSADMVFIKKNTLVIVYDALN